MRIVDLTGDFAELVRNAGTTIEYKARFWTWLDGQRKSGPLRPLLDDMERHWSSVGAALSLSEARDVLRQLSPGEHEARLRSIAERFTEITGDRPDVPVILLAGLERPEGYSRFDRGANTIFIGLDHPTALAHFDHLELILSHELCHAVRDPAPEVLADYRGSATMGHDDFVARHPFREHLVSESLATSISEAAYPGRPERRYVYFAEEAIRWCRDHRREIAERMLLALEREEPYRTFYAEGSVAPDSPDCCDYWFGLHLGRSALRQAAAGELLRLPATGFLDRYLAPFLSEFLADGGRPLAPVPERPHPPRAAGLRLSSDESPLDASSLPLTVRRTYHEYESLLARHPSLARQLEERFDATVRENRLEHAGKPWDVHAFPLLMSSEEERHLRWVTDGLLRLIDQVIELYRGDRGVRAFFGFPEHVERLCLLDPGFRPHVMLGRFDSFWSGRRVRYLELNGNGAALWCIAELLGDEVRDLPELGEILDRHRAESLPLTSRMLDGLLSAWRQARGDGGRPGRVAIVDWADVATGSEQTRLAASFTRMGVPTERIAPSDLEFRDGRLHGPNGPIDLVYRRLTSIDLLERASELKALFDAAHAGAVVTVGSFASDVAHSKRLFAFLTHERWQRQLSPAQRALIDAHVPWTRMFVPGPTQYEGRRCDLKRLALAARERFVLKPAEGYEGRGVLLGAETDPAYWEAEVERRYGGAHVIQEIVHAPLRQLLLPRGSRVESVSRWLHLGEFVVDGQLAGFLARTSEELVLSAESDERVLPCLVVHSGEEVEQEREFGPAAP